MSSSIFCKQSIVWSRKAVPENRKGHVHDDDHDTEITTIFLISSDKDTEKCSFSKDIK